MPRNGSGQYTLPAGNPVTPSTVITATWANTTLNDLAASMTQSISKDGQTVAAANLPMGGFRHTGVGAALSGTNYAQAAQSQKQEFSILTSVSGTNDYIATLPFGTTLFTVGMLVILTPTVTNTGACTLSINSGTVYAISNSAGGALLAGQLVATVPVLLQWDGGKWRYVTALSSAQVVAALGYTPANKAGDTFTGNISIIPAVGEPSMPLKTADDSVQGLLAVGAVNGLSLRTITAHPVKLYTSNTVRFTISYDGAFIGTNGIPDPGFGGTWSTFVHGPQAGGTSGAALQVRNLSGDAGLTLIAPGAGGSVSLRTESTATPMLFLPGLTEAFRAGYFGPNAGFVRFKNSAYYSVQPDPGSGPGALNVDFGWGNKQKTTLAGATTLSFSYPGVGSYQLIIVSGAHAVTFPPVSASWQWLNSGGPPVVNSGTYGGVLNIYWDGVMALATYSRIGTS